MAVELTGLFQEVPGTEELRTYRLMPRRHLMEDVAPLHEGFGVDPVMFERSGWNPCATEALRAVLHYLVEDETPTASAAGRQSTRDPANASVRDITHPVSSS